MRRRRVIVALLAFAGPGTAVAATPTVEYGRFRHDVAGTVRPAPGLRVSVELQRAGAVVASAGPERVGRDGRWSLRLSGERVPAAASDVIDVHFSGSRRAPADLVVGGRGWPLFQTIGEVYDGGHIVRLECVRRDCSGARAVIGGESHRMPCSGHACSVTLDDPVTADATGYLEATWPGRGGRSRARTPITFALPRLANFCSADLVSYLVACYPVQSSVHYTWLRNGGDPVMVRSEIGGEVRGTLSRVVAGDEITLLDDELRVVGRVDVLPLRSDLVFGAMATGECAAGEWVSLKVACAPDGSFELPAVPYAYDDRTGGLTYSTPAALFASVPPDGGTIAGGDQVFTFAVGALGPYPTDPAPALSGVLTRDDGGKRIELGVIDPAGTTVPGLTPGRWTADYLARDRAGNTVRTQARFTVSG